MILKTLTDYLDGHGVKYVVIHHSPAYTAREIAVSAHIARKEVAKTVIVKIDGKPTIAVLPASEMVDFELLRKATGARSAVLAPEQEFNALFPGCEIGAMPPFGNLFGMNVIAAESLAQDEEIAFNGGTHRELVRMRFSDFQRLVQPTILKFTVERRVRADLFERGIS
jgi:Ala-tRNA(Pro) deacylase